MANDDAEPRTPVPAWAVAALLAILLFNAWWRGHTFAPSLREAIGFAPYPVARGETEPLDCDEAIYGYMARRMIAGDRLYAELSENKPPLGYWIFAMAVGLGGADELTIRLLPLPMALAATALVWWIGLRIGGPAAGCLAGLLYALMSTDPYTYGNAAMMEHAVNLFAVGSLAAMIAAGESRGRARTALVVAAGALVAAASLVKQTAALHLAVFLPVLIGWPGGGANGRERPGGRARDARAMLLGFAGPWALVACYLASRGTLGYAFGDIVRFGGAMATDLPRDPNAPPGAIRWLTGNADPAGALPPPFGPTDYVNWWGAGTWPIWLAAAPCLAWLALVGAPRGRRLVVAWTASAMVQVILPGQYWAHYYLLPMPGLALAVAATLGDLSGATAEGRSGRAAWVPSLLLIGSIMGLVAIQLRVYFLVQPEIVTVRCKGGGQWLGLRRLGRELGQRAGPWDGPALQVWGWQSPLLFYSGLDGPSRHIFTNDLMRDLAETRHPVVAPRVDELMADLRSRRPPLVMVGYEPFPELREFLGRDYLPSKLLPGTRDGRGLWVRRDLYAEFENYREMLNRPGPPPTSRSSGPRSLRPDTVPRGRPSPRPSPVPMRVPGPEWP